VKASKSLPRGAALLLPLLLLVLGVPSRAHADLLYASSISSTVGGVYTADTQSNAVNQVFGGVAVDSLVFDSQNRIIYTAFSLEEVRRYDPATRTSVTLAGPAGFSSIGDLALEPGGQSVLVSSRGNGMIYRVDLTKLNQTPTMFHTGARPDGLVYDPQGRLFAVLGRDTVVQLNPMNGAILSTSPALAGGLDGLTFDSFSGKLFVSAETSNGIYAIDPNNLASDTPLFFGQIPSADGITSDAMGNIFIAAFGNEHIYQYNIPSGMLAERTLVTGLDDLAPLSGIGSPTVPEPSAVALFGMGIIGFLCVARKAKRSGVRRA
jgi:streptogramin lyase